MSLVVALAGAMGWVQTPVYDDALAPGWASWSWSGQYDFASAALADGGAAIACQANGWGALSLHADTPFGLGAGHSGLRFRYAGPADGVWFVLEADGERVQSERVVVGTLAQVSRDVLTEIVIDLERFGPHAWTRIDLMNATGNGARFVVDDIALLTGPLGPTGFTGAEPVALDAVEVLGAGDPAALRVTLDGDAVPVIERVELASPTRTLLRLGTSLGPGALRVCDEARCFDVTLTDAAARVGDAPTHDISPDIYGIAGPRDVNASVAALGAQVVRWGGNAVSLYDPVGHFTNAGADWFFANRDGGDAAAWIAQVQGAGARAAFTLPVLDWVARDAVSCAFPPSRYGAQQNVEPYGRDCGDGRTPAGDPLRANDPRIHARPWDVAQGEAWMRSVATPPEIAFVGNELDIASETHRDVHPEPATYVELRDRFLTWSSAIKAAWPETQVAGPSSCCWWFYWNSMAGDADKGAHGGEDFLPWFLSEVAREDAASGLRRLDLLDVHYYPDAVFSDANDPATQARRLRSTRSLWDPNYIDEGWIGRDQWATQRQPNRNAVMLIPRLRALLDARYPGTRLGVTEWNWGAENELSGGLAAADALGIFGREGLDLATYWTTPGADTPAASAFALFSEFGRRSVPVDGYDPDALGVFAARDAAGALTVVAVNKRPNEARVLRLPGVEGAATLRRFGGALGARTASLEGVHVDGAVVVPAYAAVLLRVEPSAAPEVDAAVGAQDAAVGAQDATASAQDASASAQDATASAQDAAVVSPDAATTTARRGSAGCAVADAREAPGWAAALALLCLARRRRRSPASAP